MHTGNYSVLTCVDRAVLWDIWYSPDRSDRWGSRWQSDCEGCHLEWSASPTITHSSPVALHHGRGSLQISVFYIHVLWGRNCHHPDSWVMNWYRWSFI